MPPRTKPLPYQRDGLNLMKRFGGRVLLADDMGLGKTFQFIRFVHKMGLLPSIVVCPAAVKYNWEIEIMTHSGLRSEVLSGRKPAKRGAFWTPPPFTIINYDILDGWLEYLCDINAQSLGIDESQYLGNRTSKRCQMVRDLAKGGRTIKASRPGVKKKRRKRIKHVVAMTGTPFENRPKEIFPTVQMLWPKEFSSWLEFGERYCGPTRNIVGKREYNGATNLEELRQRLLASGMIRRRKIDVLDQLPSKTRTVVPLEIEKRNEYDKAAQAMRTWLGRRGAHHQNERLAKHTALKLLASKLKQKPVMQWVQNFLDHTDEKLVLFGHHKAMLEPIFNKWKSQSVLITGKVTGRRRQAAIDAFVNDPGKRLVVGNIQAAGTGINGLQKVCRVAAFIEYAWNPQKHLQAEDRLWRLGQEMGVMIYYLTAKDTIEHKLCNLIQRKNKWFTAAIDGDIPEDDFNLFDMLEQELLSS